MDWVGNVLLISVLEKIHWFHLIGVITLVLLLWKWMGLLLRKNHLLGAGLTFSSKLDWGCCIISIAKTAKKWIFDSFYEVSEEVVLYLYKFTIQLNIEYCCHVWFDAPNCYLELLDKLQNQICGTVVPSLAAFLEPLPWLIVEM